MASSRPIRAARITLISFLAATLAMAGVLAGLVQYRDASWLPRLGLDLAGGTQIVLTPGDLRRVGQRRTGRPGARHHRPTRRRAGCRRRRGDHTGREQHRRGDAGHTGSSYGGGHSRLQPDAVPPGLRDRRRSAATGDEQQQARLAEQHVELLQVVELIELLEPVEVLLVPEPVEQQQGRHALGADRGRSSNPLDPKWITPQLTRQFAALDCTDTKALDKIVDDPAKPLVACSDDGTTKYMLGPVAVRGDQIADAKAGYQVNQTGQVTNTVEIQLTFNGDATQLYSDLSKKMVQLPDTSNPANLATPQPLNALATVLTRRCSLRRASTRRSRRVRRPSPVGSASVRPRRWLSR